MANPVPTAVNIGLFPDIKQTVENGNLDSYRKLVETHGYENVTFFNATESVLHVLCSLGEKQWSTEKQDFIKYTAEQARSHLEIGDSGSQTALHKAALSGNHIAVEYLLSNNFQVNAKDLLGRTPLHLAALSDDLNHQKVMNILLAHKLCNPLLKDNQYGTVLHYAAKQKPPRIRIIRGILNYQHKRLSEKATTANWEGLPRPGDSLFRNLLEVRDRKGRTASSYGTKSKELVDAFQAGHIIATNYDVGIRDAADKAAKAASFIRNTLIRQAAAAAADTPLMELPMKQDEHAAGFEFVIPETAATSIELPVGITSDDSVLVRDTIIFGSNDSDDRQALVQQCKLLQIMLGNNMHHLTGVKSKRNSPRSPVLSQLSAIVIPNGPPLAPSAEDESLNSIFEEFTASGGPGVFTNYLLNQAGTEEMDGTRSRSSQGGTPLALESSKKRSLSTPSPDMALNEIPIQSIAALNILLGIPSFAQFVLQDRRSALGLVKLALCFYEDDKANLLSSTSGQNLATLPFQLFQRLLDTLPLDSLKGAELRQQAIDKGAFQLLLVCLAVSTHQMNGATIAITPLNLQFVVGRPSIQSTDKLVAEPPAKKQKSSGTGNGYADGENQYQTDMDELVICLLRTLAAFVNPSTPPASLSSSIFLPAELKWLIQSFHLDSAICSYLQNDSIMYVAKHVGIFKAIFHLLRSLAACPEVSSLLVPESSDGSSASSRSQSIFWLLRSLLTFLPGQLATIESEDAVGKITELAEDVILTWTVVKTVVCPDLRPNSQTNNKLYCNTMKPIGFDSSEILVKSESIDGASVSNLRFTVPFHFENDVLASGNSIDSKRMTRLALEIAALKTSLPLTVSSSVFIRCDTHRQDIMKMLITGPADTPYSNGCFEFDVYFPKDYPTSPMKVHLATTGRQTVCFNPKLNSHGEVDLSVLNAGRGRQEMWTVNSPTLLQVIIAIQSAILIPEPYFNEPKFKESRGTAEGNENSRNYNLNIRHATVNWAMLDQLKNPSPCFKLVIEKHFQLKRKEVEKQCEDWIADMENEQEGSTAVSTGLISLKRYYEMLQVELARLTPPAVSSAATSSPGDGFEELKAGMPMEVGGDGEVHDNNTIDDSSEDDGEEKIAK